VRLVLVELAEYAPTGAPADHAAPDWKHALVVAWSGLRGAVSLAAALAIPLALPNGAPFPDRSLIIFLTFSVILVTLVGGGLSLPSVVRRLHIVGGDEQRDEARRALARTAEAALARIADLERDGSLEAAHAALLRKQFQHRRDVAASSDAAASAEFEKHAAAERSILDAQRQALIAMRENGEIDNVVMRQLLTDLDRTASRPALEEEG